MEQGWLEKADGWTTETKQLRWGMIEFLRPIFERIERGEGSGYAMGGGFDKGGMSYEEGGFYYEGTLKLGAKDSGKSLENLDGIQVLHEFGSGSIKQMRISFSGDNQLRVVLSGKALEEYLADFYEEG